MDAVDAVPPIPKMTVLGLQHVLAFYAGAVIVPLVISSGLGLSAEDTIHLINADLFTCGIAVPHIIASGNRDLIERFAIPTLRGEMIGSLAITEPGGGSDVGHLTTRAETDA